MKAHKRRRAVLKRFADERWITIGKKDEDSKGRPVKIDGEGNIVGGAVPKSMHGKNLKTAFKKGDENTESPKKKKPMKGAKSWKTEATSFNKKLSARVQEMKDATETIIGSRGSFDDEDIEKAKKYFPKEKRIVVAIADRYGPGKANYYEYEVTGWSKIKDGRTVSIKMTDESKAAHGKEGPQYEKYTKTNLRNLAKIADEDTYRIYF